MTEPKPMDPKRLADLLEHLSTYPPGTRLMLGRDEVAELLADRDYQEAERRKAVEASDYLARLTGSAITRATCIAPGETVVERDPAIAGDALTGAVERLRARAEQAERERDEARREVARLRAELNTPHVVEFLDAVRIEAVHQRERWGTEHDAGKSAADWFWLLGYLAGKAIAADKAGDREKVLHHIVTSAAALANWHAQTIGADSRMPLEGGR